MGRMYREMDLERMEGSRLRQRISNVLRASLRSSCSITSRNVTHAVHEPVLVPSRYDHGYNAQDGFDRFRSSLPPVPSQHRRLCAHRREIMAAVGDPPRLPAHCRPASAMRKPGKKSRDQKDRRVPEREGRLCPPASQLSNSCYRFKQMEEELEREERRIATQKKKVTEGKRTKKKLLSNSYGFTSSSSEDSDKDEVLFGSDETETLFSSRSFSSDSSEFYYSSSCRCSRRKKKKKTDAQRLRRQQLQKPREREGEASRHCPTLVDGFHPLVSISSSSSSSSPKSPCLSGTAKTHEDTAAAEMMEVEEEMEAAAGTAGFAVEKQSSDPHEDFRNSMLEMIMEKQVFGDRDLESLLLRYLSLNSPHHHPTILEVFSEIRETLFGY